MRLLAIVGLGIALLALPFAGGARAQTEPARGPHETAIFAGGCFWCVESDFEHISGVVAAESGYTGGTLHNPSYRNHEGHLEAVRVTYDPRRVSYAQLLNFFWRHHDPFDSGGQFCDRGQSYLAAIFVTPEQREAAEISLRETERILGASIATQIRPIDRFWVAEDYHQDYYEKNPIQYRFYRARCGRDRRVREIWNEH
jgi:peptide-methionine (S)-S-oxide reductase